MSTEDNVDVGFHPNVAKTVLNCPSSGMDGNGLLNCPSSGMDTNSISDKAAGVAMCSESMFKTSTGVETFFGSGWDPLVSLNHGGSSSVVPHNEFANSHYPVILGNQSVGSSSHLVHYPCDSSLVDMVPKMPSFGSGSFSEIVSSFGLQDCGQVTETGSHLNGAASNKGIAYQEDCQNSEGGLGSSSNGKKKRKASDSPSPLHLKKNVEGGEQQKDLSGNTSDCSKEQDETRQKMEQNNSTTNLRSKQAGKQIKDNSNNNGEPPKENYIHVRAKRGQATNSHSLAERVRRERISERMRLLQELVPGCNKITGKAVMLDEIINYVQSLQQQVEFLSMKLATVNPELNIDLDQIFSKDILHASRGSNAAAAAAAALGIGPTLNSSSSHSFPGFPPGPFHPLPQAVWDSELQNIFPMGFDSNPSANNSQGPNGN